MGNRLGLERSENLWSKDMDELMRLIEMGIPIAQAVATFLLTIEYLTQQT